MSDLIQAMLRGTAQGARNLPVLKIRVDTKTKTFTINGQYDLVDLILNGILASSRVRRIELQEGELETDGARLLVVEKDPETGKDRPF